MVEVIIACLVLTIVVSSASLMWGSSRESVDVARTRSQMQSVARASLEATIADGSLHAKCDSLWQGAPTEPCRIDTSAAAPGGRSGAYAVTTQVAVVDDPADGIGAQDSDAQWRDAYDINVTVRPGKTPNRARVTPVELHGRVLQLGVENAGYASVDLCRIDDIAVAVSAGGCRDQVPLPRTQLQIQRVDVSTQSNRDARFTTTAKTDASGHADLVLERGSYRITTPTTTGYRHLKSNPEVVTIDPGQTTTVDVQTVPGPGTAQVCVSLTDVPWNEHYGYWQDATNVAWRVSGSNDVRTAYLEDLQFGTWKCAPMNDGIPGSPTGVHQGWHIVSYENVPSEKTSAQGSALLDAFAAVCGALGGWSTCDTGTTPKAFTDGTGLLAPVTFSSRAARDTGERNPFGRGMRSVCSDAPNDLVTDPLPSPFGEIQHASWKQGAGPTTIYICVRPKPIRSVQDGDGNGRADHEEGRRSGGGSGTGPTMIAVPNAKASNGSSGYKNVAPGSVLEVQGTATPRNGSPQTASGRDTIVRDSGERIQECRDSYDEGEPLTEIQLVWVTKEIGPWDADGNPTRTEQVQVEMEVIIAKTYIYNEQKAARNPNPGCAQASKGAGNSRKRSSSTGSGGSSSGGTGSSGGGGSAIEVDKGVPCPTCTWES